MKPPYEDVIFTQELTQRRRSKSTASSLEDIRYVRKV